MNKLILPFLLLSALNIFSQQKNKPLTNTYKTKDFSISYPYYWRLDTSGLMGAKFFLFAPRVDSLDIYSENVNLLTQDLSGFDEEVDLQKFKEITEESFKTSNLQAHIFESEILKTTNGKALKMIYSMTPGKNRIKVLQYCFILSKTAYVLTFTALEEEFEKQMVEGSLILESFKN